jgi:hypothetical protein
MLLSTKLFTSSPSMARNLVACSTSISRNSNASYYTNLAIHKYKYFPKSRGNVNNSRRTLTSKSTSAGTSKLGEKTAEKTTVGVKQQTQPSFMSKWMGHKEIPPKGTLKWYGEMVLICTVFAITGTSTMVLVRPAVSEVLGLKGSMKEGPWSYRICSLVIMTPLYSAMLVVVGVSVDIAVMELSFSLIDGL